MTTLDFTPSRVDLKLWAGDDEAVRLFLSTDAPDKGVFEGTWVSATAYLVNDVVEHSNVFYTALKVSTNVTPGTDATTWLAITALDLTGYTAWAAQIRASDTDAVAFTVDATLQANSIITLSVAGTVLTTQQPKGVQSWSLQATDANSKIRTLLAGAVTIFIDPTRP